jgi:hypothetical protein
VYNCEKWHLHLVAMHMLNCYSDKATNDWECEAWSDVDENELLSATIFLITGIFLNQEKIAITV